MPHRIHQPHILPLAFQTLHYIMPHASSDYLRPLNVSLARYDISTGKRAAAFLAQIAVESKELRHVSENWTSRKNFKLTSRAAHTATSQRDYFEYWYGKRANLGNETAEDGYTYRGRGAIQITGKSNYIEIGNGIGQPLVTEPDLLLDKQIDMDASAYFFARKNHLNHVADRVDPDNPTSVITVNTQLTHAVNGGLNGLAERLEYFKKALANFRSSIIQL